MRDRIMAASPEAAPARNEANLGSVGDALWRHKRSIIIPTLLMAAAAFVVANLLTPKYQSESRVLVEGRENIFLRPEAEKSMIDRSTVDQEALTSQVQLVLSRDLARDIIRDQKLAELPEFNAALNGFSPMSVLRKIGLARDPMSLTIEERVLSAYYDRLSAYAVDKSRVIVIDFQSYSPDLAARVANAIAERYLTLQQIAKQDQARAASQWLLGEIEKLRVRVAEAEAKVEEFRAKSNLFVGANNTTLSNQQLSELNSQLSAARAAKDDAETKARLIREQMRSGHPLEFSEVSNSELIRRLSEQSVTLRAQLAEQSSTLLPAHPRIKELKAQIADLDRQIRSEGEKLARAFENDARIAGARLASLTATLDQLKRQAASTTGQDVQLRALEREAKAQRDLLESYLAKFREATARDSIAAAPPDARVISRAAPSNVPYFPKKTPIVLIAALATLCLSAAFVVTGALLDTNPYRDSARIDDTAVAAEQRAPREEFHPKRPRALATTRDEPVPVQPPDEPAVVQEPPTPAEPVWAASEPVDPAPTIAAEHEPTTIEPPEYVPAIAEPPEHDEPAPTLVAPVPIQSIQDLATALQDAGDDGRRVALVGIGRNVGTTLTAIALARALASDAHVVMVDLAFVSPNLDLISDEPGAPGIANLVQGNAEFGDIITRDIDSRAHIVAAGRTDPDAPAVMDSHMLVSALDALAENYDYVVVDAGARSDASMASLQRLVTRIVLVAGDSPYDDWAMMRDQMLALGFAEVDVMHGPPPALAQRTASVAVA